MTEQRQTVAGAFAEIEKHEAVCAQRYENITDCIGEIKAELKWISRGVVAVLLAIAGWALVQLFDGKSPAEARTIPTASVKR